MIVDDYPGWRYVCEATQVVQSRLSVTHSVCDSRQDQKSDDQCARLRPAAAAVKTH